MLYTNYTNYLTKLAVTKMMQILINVYYFSNEAINSSKSPQQYYQKCFEIFFPLHPASFGSPKLCRAVALSW